MRVGGRRQIVAPAKYAFGPRGVLYDYWPYDRTSLKPIKRGGKNYAIPPNETMVFIIDLDDVEQ